jgi:hypothetical protein
VIWTRLPQELPQALDEVQFLGSEFPASYEQQGLRYLAQRSHREYDAVVRLLASAIVRLGNEAHATSVVTPFEQLPSAFHPAQAAASPLVSDPESESVFEAPHVAQAAHRAPLDSDATPVTLFVATARRSTNPDSVTGPFGTERGDLHTLRAVVTIPPMHQIGRVEGPSLWRLQLRQDATRHVVLRDLEAVSFDDFAERALQSGETRDAIFYVHGFNVTFDSNIRQAAVLAHDLQWPGCVVVVDWASAGKVTSYLADVQSAEAAEPLFGQLAARFRPGGRRVVIARDVGCRPVLRVLGDTVDRIDELILIQPEVDRENLALLLTRLSGRVRRTTIYTTPNNAGWAAIGLYQRSTPFGTKPGDRLDLPDVDVIDVLGEPTFLSTDYYPDGLIPWHDLYHVLAGVEAADRFRLSRRPGGWQLGLAGSADSERDA